MLTSRDRATAADAADADAGQCLRRRRCGEYMDEEVSEHGPLPRLPDLTRRGTAHHPQRVRACSTHGAYMHMHV